MSTDTKLDDLIVNSLTREQYHNANFTGHENELFVQSDHAGVGIGGSGVDALDTTNVSNCITNIPEDINLELSSNGTLTLKAGSKVYVPNGSGVFDVVNITADKTTSASANGVWIYFINESGNLQRWAVNECFSGTTAPTSIHYPMWYDTTNNIIKSSDDYGSTWTGKFSFPIAIVTVSNGAISSIDQVFNGFGYIGSTIFALPGVKGLIPNGRNKDGSLKNIEFTNTIVRGVNVSGTGSGSIVVATLGMGVNSYAYDEVKNAIFNTDTGNYYNADRFIVGNVSFSNSVITLFRPKTVFHAVDYSDSEYIAHHSEYIAHQAMPSNRSINLTLGASGATYTAPADGWLFLNKTQGTANTRIEMYNKSSTQRTLCIGSSSTGQWIYGSIQAKKDDVIEVVYSVTGSTNAFRFIYAQGAQ